MTEQTSIDSEPGGVPASRSQADPFWHRVLRLVGLAPALLPELLLAIGIALALIALRSFVFVCFEQHFDSDQAIIGLMAKHISEGRAFPLFFYGQNYMLGVQAWMAVPFFWIGGPTIAMLRTPLFLVNVALSAALIIGFTRQGLRPLIALLVALPVVAAGPVTSGELLRVLGASVEPLLYVTVLWWLRNRPIAFGALLCFGSLHREFTIFALPPIVLLQWLEHRRVRWQAVGQALAGFASVWLIIDQLERHVASALPATAGAGGDTASLALEAVQVGKVLSFHLATYVGRLQLLLTQGLPDQWGLRPLALVDAGVWSTHSAGSWLAGAALLTALVVCLVGIASNRRTPSGWPRLAIYLGLVALQCVLAYGLHGGTAVEGRTEPSYALLALLLPVSIVGAFFQRESRPAWRIAVTALMLVWAVPTTLDNVRLVHEFMVSPPANEHRVLADHLTSHRIKYGRAIYWDSYRVTFLARERVILASTETVRIEAYQSRVEAAGVNAVTVVREPCGQGTHVAAWCVIDPLNR